MDQNFPYITRQDIVSFPFPYKLWLVVHLEYCEFLRWNRDGTVILLDLVALEGYLNSLNSIFRIKNISSFLQHLEEFQFVRLNAKPEAEEDLLLQYKNENFQRHRLDLLAKIRKQTYQLIGQQPIDSFQEVKNDKVQKISISNHVAERMLGDLCFMFHGGLSKIKKCRLRFQTVLQFNNEKRILQNKLFASESAQHSVKNKQENSLRQSSNSSIVPQDDQVIELPAELFENPHDSVLYLGDDIHPEYAGYYGNCSKDRILQFFGEYLPMYEDGSMEVKQKLMDNCTNIVNNNPLLINDECNKVQYSSPNIIDKSNIFIPNPIASDSIYNLNFSSNLEPLHITNDNMENNNPNTNNYNNNNQFIVTHLNSSNFNDEANISMEEFIKFKNVNTASYCAEINRTENICTEPSQQKNDENIIFPQMPTSVQMEITGDVKKNEASFRNFFSQYRASLNLLYERQ